VTHVQYKCIQTV